MQKCILSSYNKFNIFTRKKQFLIFLNFATAEFVIGVKMQYNINMYNNIKKILIFNVAFFLFFVFFTPRSNAATEAVSVIRQDCAGQNSCYTSLAAWEAGYGGIDFMGCTVGDLTCVDKIAVAQIEGIWTISDTLPLGINGWTTDSMRYIKIYTAPEAKHKGKWTQDAYSLSYISTSGIKNAISIYENNVMIDGLQIAITNSSPAYTANGISAVNQDATSDIKISNNIVKGILSNGAQGVGVYIANSNIISKVWNNIIYDFSTPSASAGLVIGQGSHYLYNNTIKDSYFGIYQIYSGVSYIKNNLSANNIGGDFYKSSGTIAVFSNNASSDASATGGTNNKANQVFAFQDMAGDDFHLAQSDMVAKSAGLNFSTDANIAFNIDIDGNIRDSSWDIGADEVVVVVTGDTTAPSVPINIKASAISAHRVDLFWDVSTDDVSVTGYKIFRDGVQIGTSATAKFVDSGLTAGIVYKYSISAYDASGKESAQSAQISFKTAFLSAGVAYGEIYKSEAYISYIKSLGTGTTNITINWELFEPTQGNYDFTLIDSFTEQISGNVDPLIRINTRKGSEDWAMVPGSGNTVPKDLSIGGVFYNHVFNIVKRTNGKVKYFEYVWEADCVPKHWGGTSDQYAQSMIIFYKAVKDANPEAMAVIGTANGTLGVCSAFTTRVLDYLAQNQPESFDLFDMHLYHHSTSQAEMFLYDIPERVSYFRNLLDSYPAFKNKPIIVTEYGGPSPSEFAYIDQQKYKDLQTEMGADLCVMAGDLKSTPLHPEGYPDQFRMFAYGLQNEPELEAKRDRIQGKQMTQRTILAMASGVEKMYWWNLKNDTSNIGCILRHPVYGKMRLTEVMKDGALSPLAPYYSYQIMAYDLYGAKSVTRVNSDPQIYLFKIIRFDNTSMYVLWERRDEFSGETLPPTQYALPIPWQSARMTDVFGNRQSQTNLGGNITLSLTDTPVFIMEDKDILPPTMPLLTKAVSPSSTLVNLSWITSADDIGVAGYRIYRDGVQIAEGITTGSYSDIGVSPSTVYTYSVAAYDGSGKSSLSNLTSVKTLVVVDTSAVTLSVDASNKIGAIPDISGGINFWGSDEAKNRFESEVGYGLYRFKILFDQVPNDLSNISVRDGLDYYPVLKPRIKKAHANGGKILLEFYGVPQWLSSCGSDPNAGKKEVNNLYNYSRCVPSDMAQWTNLVNTFLTGLGEPVDYIEFFGEANIQTTWTDASCFTVACSATVAASLKSKYIDVYRATYDAIKNLTPRPKIGGMAFAAIPLNKFEDWMPVIKTIKDAGLPFEYFSWHQYKPYLSVIISDVMKRSENFLTLYGLADIEILVTEWNANFLPQDTRHDNQYGSSFVVRTLMEMINNGVTHQNFYSLALPETRQGTARYTGDFGVFTSDVSPVPKASYNAFRLFSKLKNERIYVNNTDVVSTYSPGAGYVYNYKSFDAIAAKNGNTIYALGSYFIPKDVSSPMSYEYSKPINFQIVNIPFSKYHYKIYLIDANNSNGYTNGVSPELTIIKEGDSSGNFNYDTALAVYGVLMVEISDTFVSVIEPPIVYGGGGGGGFSPAPIVPVQPTQPLPTPTPVTPPTLKEGDLVKGPDGIKVYIINAFSFKRHIFNPAIFNMYGHFKWNEIKSVDQATLDSYKTSDFYKADSDPRVFSLHEIDEAQGLAQKRWLDISGEKFTQLGYKWDQVFIINEKERDYYQEGTPIGEEELSLGGFDQATIPELKSGVIAKSYDNPIVYFITESNLKKPILNETVFNSYPQNRWENIKTVSNDVLNSYPNVQAIQLENGDGKIYMIDFSKGQKQWIKTPEAFNKLGLFWNRIVPVNKVEFNAYYESAPIE